MYYLFFIYIVSIGFGCEEFFTEHGFTNGSLAQRLFEKVSDPYSQQRLQKLKLRPTLVEKELPPFEPAKFIQFDELTIMTNEVKEWQWYFVKARSKHKGNNDRPLDPQGAFGGAPRISQDEFDITDFLGVINQWSMGGNDRLNLMFEGHKPGYIYNLPTYSQIDYLTGRSINGEVSRVHDAGRNCVKLKASKTQAELIYQDHFREEWLADPDPGSPNSYKLVHSMLPHGVKGHCRITGAIFIEKKKLSFRLIRTHPAQ